LKKASYPDLNASYRLEREALESAKAQLLAKGVGYPRLEDFEDSSAFYEAVRVYSDTESMLVRLYKQTPKSVPCETSNKEIRNHHWMDEK